MYMFLFTVGSLIIILLFIWKYIESSHGHIVKKYIQTPKKSANSSQEYRRLAKKALRDKDFSLAEEYYAKAKSMEGKG